MWGTLIYLALSGHFGESAVFLDCSSLRPGDDFEKVLLDRVRESTLLLAVIGPRWLTAASGSGERLIDSSQDWVHRELAEAFAVGVRVIPVLTDGADMPTTEMLPLDIAALGGRQFVRLRRRQATDDLAGLVGKVADLAPALSPVPARESVRTAPAWAAATRRRRRVRLPAQLTELLGRAGEIGQVGDALSAGRLVTLVGPGGVGKTRLALAAATAVADRFVDGVVFVPLAEVTWADLVVAAVARALDVREVPGLPLLDCVVDHLAGARLLLLLDNFEHVLDAGATVSAILAAAPGAAVLVTSREPLNLYGERIHRVPPLHVPPYSELPPGAAGVVQALTGSAAVALFDQRARAVNADFELTPANLAAVLTICRRLDGLPLAIELAAAHAGRFSPAALLTGLTGHLEAPEAGPRDRPERQRTLRGAIGWSYDLLDPEQQRLFRRFAVFAGGATLEAAAAVVDADRPVELGQALWRPAGPGALGPGPDLAGRLAALAAKSLLVVEEAGGGVRYRMLETIRAYATALLAEDPAQDLAHARHAVYYVDLAERVGPAMAGAGQADAAGRLEQDYQNLRAAMAWMLTTGQPAEAARACLGLWRHWRTGRHFAEGRSWLREVLAAPAGLPDDMRGRVLYAAAVLAAAQDDHEVAARLAAECLTLADAAGDLPATAQAHNAGGIAAIGAGDYPTAAAHFRCSLATCRQLADQHGTAIALGNLARLSLRLDEIPTAARYIDECLRIERATDNTYGITLGLETLGRICLARHDLPAAGTALRESLALSREIGDIYGQTAALHLLGLVAHDAGDHDKALNLLTDALDRHHVLDCPEDLAISLDCLANATADRHPTSAARLLGTADQLRRRHRLPIPSENETRRDASLTILRTRLDQTAFTAAWNTGHTTPPDETIHEATDLRERGEAGGLRPPQSRK
jgi:predicted ATPase